MSPRRLAPGSIVINVAALSSPDRFTEPAAPEPQLPTPVPAKPRTWLQRHVVDPLTALLRMGATPEKLAWSLAIGIAVGINPLLGSTTILGLAVMAIFRLNLAASQIANHLCYPLQLLLFFPFIRLGERVFHAGPLPIHGKLLLHEARIHPIHTTQVLWTWEWHAMVVWLFVASALAPLLANLLIPVLRKTMIRLHPEPDA